MDLVILAAGMGSRFGGLKQIEPIDEFNNFIIDYSIFDAKRAGFERVIFIIKEENYELFKSTIGKRVEDKIETHYVFQSLDILPEGYKLPSDRVNPLGTAQAILACKDIIDEKFVIINADDFYGLDAYLVAAKYLNNLAYDSKFKYANVGYEVKNTMTENGSVKRGVLNVDNGMLKSIIESKIEKVNNKIICEALDNSITYEVEPNTLVSMNMFCLTKDILKYIEDKFPIFLDENKDNLYKCEYLLPTVISDLINENLITVEVLSTNAIWYGVTYKSDKDYVVESLSKLRKSGLYPNELWK